MKSLIGWLWDKWLRWRGKHESVSPPQLPILSDGQPYQVLRPLGLFELDGLGPDIPGPYRYSILTYTGVVYEVEYQPSDTPPVKPDEVEPEAGSPAWHQLREWDTHQAYLAHEVMRNRAIEQWLNNCAGHILASCLDETTRLRLVEPEDYQKIYARVCVPRLTLDDIAAVLRHTFRANFDGLDILDAMWKLEPGLAKLNPVALWESQLLNELGLVTPEQEAEYAHLPVMTRARKVAAFKLADWLGALEADRVQREMKRGN